MTTDDRIAIVGLACRVPGAPDVGTFWHNLRAGVDAVRRFTPAELAALGVPPELAGDPAYVPAFGHLDGLEGFDAALFGYTDDQAALLDPQHRIFLELAWWALEDAAHDPARSDAQVGVFAGCGANRYLRHHLLGNPAAAPGARFAEDWDDVLAGGTSDYLPLRVAYAMGLTGPAVAVQTACSSSLVAVCQAAQSLLDFRCDVAIAGGAAVVSTRQAGYLHRPGGTWAPDGVCRPFDAGATGQVFGNGGGAVVLKRLDDAVADGDRVHGVLAGWAVTNDGAARAGFTAPGVSGQAAVVAEALAAADWDPAGVGFIEAHGSGTPVGDAIEIEALARALRGSGACRLGSVKGNVGNLDAAAGVVGLIKTVLAVRDGVIPPTLHFRRPHPDVDLAATPFTVTTSTQDWTGPRRAGVSSFGLGGTNAHVLIEEPPSAERPQEPPSWLLLPLSAAEPAALSALAARLAAHPVGLGVPTSPAGAGLATEPGAHAGTGSLASRGSLGDTGSLADVAYTLATGRRRLPQRAAVVAGDGTEAAVALGTLAAGQAPPLPADAPAELRDQAARWLAGGDVPAGQGRTVSLAGYPFQRRRHWIEPLADRP